MSFVKYISNFIMPAIICYILICGLKERKNVYDLFLEGTKEGVKIIYNISFSIIAIYIAIYFLIDSGLLDKIVELLNIVLKKINFPKEIIPLAVVRPISGSAALGLSTEIMKKNGVDSYIGKIAATLLGATETTLYILSLYIGNKKLKGIWKVVCAAILADVAGIASAVTIWSLIK